VVVAALVAVAVAEAEAVAVALVALLALLWVGWLSFDYSFGGDVEFVSPGIF
jgi:hypothetical protein